MSSPNPTTLATNSPDLTSLTCPSPTDTYPTKSASKDTVIEHSFIRQPNQTPDLKPFTVNTHKTQWLHEPVDLEKCTHLNHGPRVHHGEGSYCSFSSFIASEPTLEIYRRFNRLAARNILYLQSELLHLEALLDELDAEDENEADEEHPLLEMSKSWELMSVLAESGNRKAKERYELIMRIRALMAEYQKAMLSQSDMLSLNKPHRRSLVAVASWFVRFKPFNGLASTLFQAPTPRTSGGSNRKTSTNIASTEPAKVTVNPADSDHVALQNIQDPDRLSLFVEKRFSKFFRAPVPTYINGHPSLYYYPEHKVNLFINIISMLFAALLLIGGIVAIYVVHGTWNKILVNAVFTIAFALSLACLTNAKRSEVYATTAGYMAVMIVFMAGDIKV